MSRSRVLVVDDDPHILSVITRGLTFAGYDVYSADTGESALPLANHRPPDLIILDVLLPGLDGLEVCRRLRSHARELPILMLTAKGRIPDRVAGLDAGADDYLVKPFSFDELLARVRALLRRASPVDDLQLRFADLTVDLETRDVRRGERRVDLTSKEFELIEFLIRNSRKVLSRNQIFESVWGSDFLGGSNLIDVHIMRLREKLEAHGESRLIHTVRGAGYTLREE